MILPNDPIHNKMRKLVSLQRRKLASESLEKFIQVYLAPYANLPPSRMHRELMQLLDSKNLHAGTKLAVAAPRGHAKSTLVSLALVLHSICFGTERFIFLIGNTMEAAETLLRHVKDQLTDNRELIEDFPEVCEPPGSKPGPPRWNQREIITRNDIKLNAVSANSKLRGRRHKQHRPGLVICDDLETDDGVSSELRRQTLREWFSKVVLNCGTGETKFIVIGTILHYDALLARLIDEHKSPGWVGRKYQAVEKWHVNTKLWGEWEQIYNLQAVACNKWGSEGAEIFFKHFKSQMLEGTQVLWPEKESYYELMELRLTGGHASFDSEKQNDPIDPATCLFPEDSFLFWDDRFKDESELLAYLDKRATFYGACDPSLGKAGKHRDDTAIVTVARDERDGLIYVLDAYIERLDPDRIIDHVIQFHQRRRYRRFAMESVQFQEFLAKELRKQSRIRGCPVPISEIKPSKDKMGRIQSLQPIVKSGGALFSRRHRTLLEQMRQFPKAAHDDGPDALHMAIEIATPQQRKPGIMFVRMGTFPGTNLIGFAPDNDNDDDDDDYDPKRFGLKDTRPNR